MILKTYTYIASVPSAGTDISSSTRPRGNRAAARPSSTCAVDPFPGVNSRSIVVDGANAVGRIDVRAIQEVWIAPVIVVVVVPGRQLAALLLRSLPRLLVVLVEPFLVS